MDEEYKRDDVEKELRSLRTKIADNARLQLVAAEHSDILNLILHRTTLKELQKKAEVLHEYEQALSKLLTQDNVKSQK